MQTFITYHQGWYQTKHASSSVSPNSYNPHTHNHLLFMCHLQVPVHDNLGSVALWQICRNINHNDAWFEQMLVIWVVRKYPCINHILPNLDMSFIQTVFMLHNKWCVCAAQGCHIRLIISRFGSNFSIFCSGYPAITYHMILYNTVASIYINIYYYCC